MLKNLDFLPSGFFFYQNTTGIPDLIKGGVDFSPYCSDNPEKILFFSVGLFPLPRSFRSHDGFENAAVPR
jgi:hypothetical protein